MDDDVAEAGWGTGALTLFGLTFGGLSLYLLLETDVGGAEAGPVASVASAYDRIIHAGLAWLGAILSRAIEHANKASPVVLRLAASWPHGLAVTTSIALSGMVECRRYLGNVPAIIWLLAVIAVGAVALAIPASSHPLIAWLMKVGAVAYFVPYLLVFGGGVLMLLLLDDALPFVAHLLEAMFGFFDAPVEPVLRFAARAFACVIGAALWVLAGLVYWISVQ